MPGFWTEMFLAKITCSGICSARSNAIDSWRLFLCIFSKQTQCLAATCETTTALTLILTHCAMNTRLFNGNAHSSQMYRLNHQFKKYIQHLWTTELNFIIHTKCFVIRNDCMILRYCLDLKLTGSGRRTVNICTNCTCMFEFVQSLRTR